MDFCSCGGQTWRLACEHWSPAPWLRRLILIIHRHQWQFLQCKESKRTPQLWPEAPCDLPQSPSSSESSVLPGSCSSPARLQAEPSVCYLYSAFKGDTQANQMGNSLTWALSPVTGVEWCHKHLIFSVLQKEVYRVEELLFNNHPLILVWMFGLVTSQKKEEKR